MLWLEGLVPYPLGYVILRTTALAQYIQVHGPHDSKLCGGHYCSVLASCLGHPLTEDEKGVCVLPHLRPL